MIVEKNSTDNPAIRAPWQAPEPTASTGAFPSPGTLAPTFRVPIGRTAPPDPQKRRHRRHLLAAKGVTNDGVFRSKKLSKQLSSPSTLTNDDVVAAVRPTRLDAPRRNVPVTLRGALDDLSPACDVQPSTPIGHFVLHIRRASLRHKDYGKTPSVEFASHGPNSSPKVACSNAGNTPVRRPSALARQGSS